MHLPAGTKGEPALFTEAVKSTLIIVFAIKQNINIEVLFFSFQYNIFLPFSLLKYFVKYSIKDNAFPYFLYKRKSIQKKCFHFMPSIRVNVPVVDFIIAIFIYFSILRPALDSRMAVGGGPDCR